VVLAAVAGTVAAAVLTGVPATGRSAVASAIPRHGPPVTTCGIPYDARVGARSIESGSCAGLIERRAPRVTMHVGQRLRLTIESEQSGGLVVPIPASTSHALARISRHGAVVVYAARAVGRARLVSRGTRFCIAHDPHLGSCAAYRVRVIRR
jgi:hypothetical protein